jgi:lipoyl(octanoyl) transferase
MAKDSVNPPLFTENPYPIPIQPDLIIRRWPLTPYYSTWQAMQRFTEQRLETTCDELWLVEHPPVFTLGQNTKPEHLLDPGAIPVIATDRGGQVTYHGPGQLVAYVLLDIKRKLSGIRALVSFLEQCVIDLLSFNVAMDIAPFSRINPCGYPNLPITQLSSLIKHKTLDKELVLAQLVQQLIEHLQYKQPLFFFEPLYE